MNRRDDGDKRAMAIARAIALLLAASAIGLAWWAAHRRPDPRAARTGVTCAAVDLTLVRFPLNGVAARDWMINSYLDLDPTSPGIADYRSHRGALARTYDGHRGIDIDIPSFRQMDSDGAVIYSATPGVVDQIIQDQPDRHTRCAGTWNLVRVRHANGFRIIYGHIKTGSARVIVGQTVEVGTPLAIVGSAGCSTQPHLHLEVRDCAGVAVDPFQWPGMWRQAPAYDVASDVMDVMLSPGPAPTLAQIKDPAARNPTGIAPGGALGIGLSVAVRGGDVLSVSLIDPRGAATTQRVIVGGAPRLSHRHASLAFPVNALAGIWTVEIRINDDLKASRAMTQESHGPRR